MPSRRDASRGGWLSSRWRATSVEVWASAWCAIQAIIMSRIAAAPAQVTRLLENENSDCAMRILGNSSWKPARLSQWTAAACWSRRPASASARLPFSMPTNSAPVRAIRFSQRVRARLPAVRAGSKLANTKSDVQPAASVRSPSTGMSLPLLARTGLPSSEIVRHSNTVAWASQFATNRGSVTAARPKLENSGAAAERAFARSPAKAKLRCRACRSMTRCHALPAQFRHEPVAILQARRHGRT